MSNGSSGQVNFKDRRTKKRVSEVNQEDEFTLNIQHDLSLLLNSEANSPTTSDRGVKPIGRNEELKDIERREIKSRNNSFLISDGSEDCNSECSLPCNNPKHIDARILDIVNHVDHSELFTKQEEGLFNKLFKDQKPKSMISMFVQA